MSTDPWQTKPGVPSDHFCWETPDRKCDRGCGAVCRRFAGEAALRMPPVAAGIPATTATPFSWRRVLRDVVDTLVIGALMIATGVFAVVAIMMLDGFEPPAWLVAYGAMAGGAYASFSVGGMIIGRHIRWRS